jgi:sporulation protein YlmC with PRC-barrel domain
MRAVDLIGARVFDVTGAELGAVHDLVFEAKGVHIVDSGQPAYRLAAVECGAVGVAHRLGYGHRDMAGPWPLNHVLARLSQRSITVAWDHIATIDGAGIHLSVARADLPRIGQDHT